MKFWKLLASDVRPLFRSSCVVPCELVVLALGVVSLAGSELTTGFTLTGAMVMGPAPQMVMSTPPGLEARGRVAMTEGASAGASAKALNTGVPACCPPCEVAPWPPLDVKLRPLCETSRPACCRDCCRSPARLL